MTPDSCFDWTFGRSAKGCRRQASVLSFDQSLKCLLAAVLCCPATATGIQLSDAKAAAGRLFVYTIPDSVFPGVEHLQVTEASHDSLPKWIYYNSNLRTLTGVPLSEDKGVYIVSVQPLSGKHAELFAISVALYDWTDYEQQPISASNLQSPAASASWATCAHEGEVMVASIILDEVSGNLKGRERVHLLRTVASQLGMHQHTSVEEMRLSVATGAELAFRKGKHSPSSIIVAGPGNVVALQKPPGTAVSWPVGCRSISESDIKILELLEAVSEDGTLAEALSLDVAGWSVTGLQTAGNLVVSGRSRRQAVRVTATPVPSHSPMSAVLVGEGEISRSSQPVLASSASHHVSSSALHPAAPVHVRPTAVVSSAGASLSPDGIGAFYITTPPLPPPFPITGVRHASVTTKEPFPSSSSATPHQGSATVPQTQKTFAVDSRDTSTALANLPPKVLEAIPEQSAYVGQLHSFEIPEETFFDEEDDTSTSGLQVNVVTSAGLPVQITDGWLTFDSGNLTVTMLPDASVVGRHTFAVEAMDAAGAKARTRLVVNVLPTSSAADKAAQLYTMTLGIDFDAFVASRRNSMARLAVALRTLHAGRSIVITDIRRGSVVVSYVVLPAGGSPEAAVAGCGELSVRLDNSRVFNGDGSVRLEALRSLPFPVTSLRTEPLGLCVGKLPSLGGLVSTTKPSSVTATTAAPKQYEGSVPQVDHAPRATTELHEVSVELGKEFHYEIPRSLFVDEDGDVANLSLRLMIDRGDYEEAVKTHFSWLKLTTHGHGSGGSTKILHGLPWRMSDTKQAYSLRASDVGGREAAVAVRFRVVRESARTLATAPVMLSLLLSQPHTSGGLLSNVNEQLRVLKRVSAAYGDNDTRHIAVLDITGEGPTANVTWTNTSIVHGAEAKCPVERILSLTSPLAKKGLILPAFSDAMKPLTVHAFELRPLRGCAQSGMQPYVAFPHRGDDDGGGRKGSSHDGQQPDRDALVSIVAPVAVIVLLLVIAVVVAAILVARRRRRAREARGSAGAAKACMGKGVPVIFDEELDDNAACQQKLVESESKSVPPPAYPGEQDDDARAAETADGEQEASDGDTPPNAEAEQRQPLLGGKEAGDVRPPPHQGHEGSQRLSSNAEDVDVVPPYRPPTPPASDGESSTVVLRPPTGNGLAKDSSVLIQP